MLLPAPDSPVSHTTAGCCPSSAARAGTFIKKRRFRYCRAAYHAGSMEAITSPPLLMAALYLTPLRVRVTSSNG